MNRTACRPAKALAAMALTMAACTAEEDMRLDSITSQTENPPVYLHITDEEGHDLVAAGEKVSIAVPATGMRQDYDTAEAEECALPWGRRGTLIKVSPAEPYHAPTDNEFVYTLNPTTEITVGSAQPIKLQRTFDYDLRRYRTAGNGRAVDVSYFPALTRLQGKALDSDTALIIIEGGMPCLRVDSEVLTVEMLFNQSSDALAQPLKQLAQGEWANDLMTVSLNFQGRTIARPAGHVSTAAGNGTLAVRVSLRLPYIYEYASDYITYQMFSYSYSVRSSTIFGDDHEHWVDADLFDINGRKLQIGRLTRDGKQLEPRFTAPYYILVDWRGETNEP